MESDNIFSLAYMERSNANHAPTNVVEDLGADSSDDDGLAQPSISQPIVLPALPVLAPHPAPRRWTQLRRHACSELAVPMVVFAAVLSHKILIVKLRGTFTEVSSFGTAVIATITHMATTTLLSNQLACGYRQPSRDPEHLLGHHLCSLWFISCSLVPMLALPAGKRSSLASQPIAIGKTTFGTLMSWTESLPKMRFSIPFLLQGESASSLSPWFVTLPEYFGQFSAAYMPMLSLANDKVYPEHVLEVHMNTTTQLLTLQMNCKSGVAERSTLNSLNDGRAVFSVYIHDDEHCTAKVDLYGSRISEGKKQLNSDLWTGVPEKSWAGLYLNNIDEILRRSAPVTAFSLGSSHFTLLTDNASMSKGVCKNRVAFVGLTTPIQAEGVKPSCANVDVAICQPVFAVADAAISFQRRQDWPSRGLNAHHRGSEYLGNIVPDWRSFFIRGNVTWRSGNFTGADHLLEAFMDDFDTYHFLGNVNFTDQIATNIHNRQTSNNYSGSIEYFSRQLSDLFLARIATAAELTVQERLATSSPEFLNSTEEVATLWIDNTPIQDAASFQIILWSLMIIICFSTIRRLWRTIWLPKEKSQFVHASNTATVSENLVPWSLNSPAALALLLRNSKTRPWLRALRRGYCEVAELPNIYIGRWRAYGTAPRGEWRADVASQYQQDTVSPDPAKQLDRRLTEDFIAIITFSNLGIFAAFSALIYFVIQLVICFRGWTLPCLLDEDSILWRIQGKGNILPKRSFWVYLGLDIYPAMVLSYCFLFWLPLVYRTVSLRLPWSALFYETQTAPKSVALDYSADIFPLVKSIHNKHWLFSLLIIGNLSGLFVPFTLYRLVDRKIRNVQLAPFLASRPYDWSDHKQSFQTVEQSVYDNALRTFAENVASTKQYSRQLSFNATLPPIYFVPDVLSGSSYLQYSTEALYTSLDCEEAIIQKDKEGLASILFSIPDEGGRSHQRESSLLSITLPQLCGDRSEGGPGSKLTADTTTDGRSKNSYIQWFLKEVTMDSAARVPLWIVAIQNAALGQSQSSGRFQSAGSPGTVAIACLPRISKKTVNVTLAFDRVSDPESLSVVNIKGFGAAMEYNSEALMALSHGLNTSNMGFQSATTGLMLPEGQIQTDRFYGDFLSWMLHRETFSTSLESLQQVNILKAAASEVFSGYVSSLAKQEGSPLVTHDLHPEKLNLYPVVMREEVYVNWGAAIFHLSLLIVCLFVFRALNRDGRFYLPLSPEPLIHGLLLVSEGDFITWIEEEFPSPENLTLQTIFRRIGSRGFRFRVEAWKQKVEGLNLALNVVPSSDEEAVFEQYHDSFSSDEEPHSPLRRRQTWEADG